jgi:hypothetical protein
LIKQQLSGKELHKPKQPEQVSGGLLLDETDRGMLIYINV